MTNDYNDYLNTIDKLKSCGYFIYDTEIETIEESIDTIESMNTVFTGVYKKPECRYVIKFLK